MAEKEKKKIINITITPNTFASLIKKIVGETSNYEFSDIAELRHILSNEKAKILYSIKYSNPRSIYHLAKLLKRDFKSVLEDVRLLQKFGFIELKKEFKGKRKKFKPVLSITSLHIIFNI